MSFHAGKLDNMNQITMEKYCTYAILKIKGRLRHHFLNNDMDEPIPLYLSFT